MNRFDEQAGPTPAGEGPVPSPAGAAAEPSGRRPPMRRRDWATLLVIVLGVTTASQLWQNHLADRDGPALAALARAGDIHMVSSVTCIYCQRAREWLTRYQVPFSECAIERDADCRRQYQALQAPGTPVLLVQGEVQLGFSGSRVLERLQRVRASGAAPAASGAASALGG